MEMTTTRMPANMLRISLSGSLDLAGTTQINTAFSEVAASSRYILVDLQAVNFLASVAVRMLVLNARALQSRGGRMVLLNPQRRVERVLQTLDIEKIIPVCMDLDQALAKLSKGP